MSVGLEAVAASPLRVTLGDKAYQIGKLTLEDWAAFCQWIKDGRREDIAGVDLPAREKRDLYRDLLSSPIEPDEMFRHAMTLPGLRWLIHRALSKHHAIAIEDVGDLVGGIDKLTDLFELIADVPDEDENGGADPLEVPQAAD